MYFSRVKRKSHILFKFGVLFIIALVFFVSNFISSVQAADVPTIIGYQGRLADADSNLLGGAGTNYHFKISFWTSPTVGLGTKVWPVGAPSDYTTTVRHGLFNINIGDTVNGYPDALDYNFSNNSNVYLQVEVSANGSSFETVSPRQAVASAPFALVAGSVSGSGASTMGSLQVNGNSTTTGSSYLGNLVGLANQYISQWSDLSSYLPAGFSSSSADLWASTKDFTSNILGVLGINHGGTGTSTAPGVGQVLIGNASGGYDFVAASSLSSSILGSNNTWMGTNDFNVTTTFAGRVGIGTANPTYMLDVNGAGKINNFVIGTGSAVGYYALNTYGTGPQVRFFDTVGSYATLGARALSIGSNYGSNTAPVGGMIIEGRVGIGTSSPISTLSVKGTAGTNPFTITSSTDASLFAVLQSGNVGIGTTTPVHKLSVVGSINATYQLIAGSPGTSVGDTNIRMYYDTTLNGGLGSGIIYSANWSGYYTPTIINPNGGNVGIGTTSPVSALSLKGGTTAASGINFGDSGSNLYRTGNGAIKSDGSITGSQLKTAGAEMGGNYGSYPGLYLTNSSMVQWFNGAINTTIDTSIARNTAGVLEINNGIAGQIAATKLLVGSIGIGTTSPVATLSVKGTAGFDPFTITSSTDISMFTILQNGNVGIGTASPNYALEVNGDIGIPYTGKLRSATDSRNYITLHDGSGNMAIYGSDGIVAVPRIYIKYPSGNIGIGTTTPAYGLDVAGDIRSISGYYRPAPSAAAGTYLQMDGVAGSVLSYGNSQQILLNSLGIQFKTIGEQMRLTNFGNLGIGTTTPSQTLDVNGNIALTTTTPSIYFGAVTNTVPMLKRNGANLSVRRADDSSYADLYVKQLITNASIYVGNDFSYAWGDGTSGINGSGASDFISFRTSDIEAMRINPSGNLGIGLINPLARLTVQGTSTSALMNITTSSTASALYVDASGNVGIGTAVPGSKLEVVSSDSAMSPTSGSGLLYLNNTYSGTESSNLMFGTNNLRRAVLSAGKDGVGTTGGYFAITTRQDSDALFYERFRIDNAGNVGIGTTSPISTLSVSGTAGTNPFTISSSTGGSMFTILQNGNIGIGGMVAPIYTVDITGSLRTSNNIIVSGTNYSGAIVDNNNGRWSLSNNLFTMGRDTYFAWGPNTAYGSPDISLSRYATGTFAIGTGAQDSYAGTLIAGSIGLGTTTNFSTLTVQAASGVSALNVASSTGVSILTVASNGNVGIGTANPTELLTIGNGGDNALYSTTDLLVTRAGASSLEVRDSTSNQSGYMYVDSTRVEMGSGTNVPVKLMVNNTEIMRLLSNGNVGIGTTTPTAKLQVAGSSDMNQFVIQGNTAQTSDIFQINNSSGNNLVRILGTGEMRFALNGTTTSGFRMYDDGANHIDGIGSNKQLIFGNFLGISMGGATFYPTASDFSQKLNLYNGVQLKTWSGAGVGQNGVWDASNGRLGLGSTTPSAMLSVQGTSTTALLNITTLGAASAMYINNSGYVGIGTTSPGQVLDVNGNSRVTNGQLEIYDTSNTARGISLYRNSVLLGGFNTNNALTSFYGATGYGLDFVVNGSGAGSAMRILSTGLVGIGTTTPLSTLTVQATSGVSALNIVSSTGLSMLSVASNGNVGIGTANPAAKLHVYGGDVIFERETGVTSTININRNGSNRWAITNVPGTTDALIFNAPSAGVSNILTLLQSGNVGIGTTTPSHPLDIVGGAGGTTGLLIERSGNPSIYAKLLDASLTLNATPAVTVSGGLLSLRGTFLNIDGGGKVGIGTISPTQKLEVYGNININSTSSYMFNGVNLANASTTLNNYFFGNAGNLSVMTGVDNLGFGPSTLAVATSGYGNLAFGNNALDVLTSGYSNIAIGTSSLTALTTGYNNIALGNWSGGNLTTGYNNILIGHGLNAAASTTSNSLNIGNLITGDLATGNVGIGSALLPNSTTTVYNDFVVGNGALMYASSTGLTTIDNIELGATSFPTDAGAVSWIDMPLTSSTASGVPVYYTANLAGNPILSVTGVSNGAGDLLSYGIGIGTTTASATLTVQATTSMAALNVVSSTGVSMLAVAANGNVGIGTTSPSNALEVNGSGYFTGNLGGANITATGTMTAGSYKIGSATVLQGSTNVYVGSSGASGSVTLQTTSGNLTLLGGNVGIGTTTPSQLLTVGNNNQFTVSSAGNVIAALGFGANGGTVAMSSRNGLGDLYQSAGVSLSYHNGSSVIAGLVVKNSGYVGIGTTTPLSTLTVQATSGVSALNVVSSTGASMLAIGTNGFVGIGTSTPITPLHVVRATAGDAIFIDSNGSSNAIFFNNPSAVMRWNGGSFFSASGFYSGTVDQQWKTWDGSAVQTRLFIKYDTGNVGIGTTTPLGKLHIEDVSATPGKVLVIRGKSGQVTPLTEWQDENGASVGSVFFTSGSYTGMTMNNYYLPASAGVFGGSYGFKFKNSLGIQWSSTSDGPNGVADLGISRGAAGKLYVGNGAVGDYSGSLIANSLGIGTTTFASSLTIQATSGVSALNVVSSTGASMLYVASNGNVGIGTTSPNQLLEVAQSIGALGSVFSQVTDSASGKNIKMGLYYPTGWHSEPGIWINQSTPNDTNYAFMGDLNDTYFNTPATGDIAFRIGNAGKMIIKASGNVGIGTTTPAYKLDVNGTGRFTSQSVLQTSLSDAFSNPSAIFDQVNNKNIGLRIGNTTGYVGYIQGTISGSSASPVLINPFGGSVAVGTSTATSQFTIQNTYSLNNIFNLRDDTGAVKLTVLNSGNVGIGTTTPTANLNIFGTTNTLLRVATSTNQNIFVIGADGNANFSNNLTVSGDTTLSGLANTFLAVDATGKIIATTTPSGSGSSTLQWTTTGNDIYYDTGKVGIGSSTPSEMLTVSGNGAFSGNLSAANLSLASTTQGSVLFAGADGLVSQNNTGINWNNSNSRLAIGASAAVSFSQVSPTMASNVLPSPYVASDSTGGAGAWQSFDGNVNTRGFISNAGFPYWVKIDMNTATAVNKYKVSSNFDTSGRSIKTWTLDGSNDNSNWTTLDTQTNATIFSSREIRTYTLSSTANYRYYRINVTANWGDSYTDINEFTLGVTGAVNPLAKIHINTAGVGEKGLIIQGTSGQTANLTEWQNDSGSTLAVIDGSGHFQLGTTTDMALFSIQGTSTAASLPFLNISSSTGSSVMYVSNSGNVGIGTASPTQKLTVNGGMNVIGSSTATCFSTDGVNCQWTNNNAEVIHSAVNPSLKLLDSSSNLFTRLLRVGTGNKMSLSNVTGGSGSAPSFATKFNSLSDHIDFSSAPSVTGNFSISAWVYRAGSGFGSNSNNTIIDVGNHPSGNGFGIWMDGSNRLGYRVNSSFSYFSYTLPLNTWVHVVLAYDGSNMNLYINNSLTANPIFTTNPNAAASMRFGARENAGEGFNGIIDEVMIYNKALSPTTEIPALYNIGDGYYGTSTLSGLVGGYHLDAGTGSSIADYSVSNITGTLTGTVAASWVAGKVSNLNGATEFEVLTSQNGLNGEFNLNTFGNDFGTSILNGTNLLFNVAGVERARFSSLGNFGIGTSTPSSNLSVVGSSTSPIATFSDELGSSLQVNNIALGLALEGHTTALGPAISAVGVKDGLFIINSSADSVYEALGSPNTIGMSFGGSDLATSSDILFEDQLGLLKLRSETIELDGAAGVKVTDLNVNGAVYSNNGVLTNANPSSRTYKNNIVDTNLNIDALLGLQIKSFNWNKTGQADFGLIAEEIQTALPELYMDDGTTKGYRADHLPFYLLQIAQKQASEIKVLSEQVSGFNSSTPLTVTDNSGSSFSTLTVQSSASFYGTITVRGEAGFESKVVFNQDIEVKGKIYASADQAGTATITINGTSTEIVFSQEYEVVPKVTAQAQVNPNAFTWISDKTTKGFRINIAGTAVTDVPFDWIVLAVKPDPNTTSTTPVVETPAPEIVIEQPSVSNPTVLGEYEVSSTPEVIPEPVMSTPPPAEVIPEPVVPPPAEVAPEPVVSESVAPEPSPIVEVVPVVTEVVSAE